MKKSKQKVLTATEVARKGGTATLKKHGKKHFAKLAAARWKNKKKTTTQ